MTAMQHDLRVTMFSGFSIKIGEQPIHIKSGSSTKVMQILQYILHAYPNPVPANTLVQKLFGDEDVINPRNNMKVSISQLRKLLATSGLPGDKYICVSSAGYYWDTPLPLTVDVHDFSEAVKAARAEPVLVRKIELLRKAVSLYTGNFLPALECIDWALSYSVYYSNLYADSVRQLASLLKQRQQWAETLLLAEKAYQFLRTDEWQVLRIECLMSMGRWEDAKLAYNEAVSMLARDYDLPPTDALLEAYNQISKHTISNQFGTFDDILSCMREENPLRGAYQCTFPGFIDLYRVMVRSMMREGTVYCLMLCTMGDREMNMIQNEDLLSIASDHVANAIRMSLRSGDFFAQYSTSQFIICLSNLCMENCPLISNRILNNYRADPVRGVHIRFETQPAEAVDSGLSATASTPTWSV